MELTGTLNPHATQAGDRSDISIQEAVKDFKADLVARCLQGSTIRKYDLLFRQLETFCSSNSLIQLRELDKKMLGNFRATWKLGPLASARHLSRLRAFFHFCQDSDYVSKNPAKLIQMPEEAKSNVIAFSDQEIEKVFKACENFNGNGPRIRLLSELMLNSGLRIGDAATVKRDDFVKTANGWQVELTAKKNRREVSVPLPDALVTAIMELPGEHPFWTGVSTPSNCASIWQESYRRLFKLAGVKGHPHQFRHTFANRLLRNSVPLETVSRLLGHTTVIVTASHYSKWTKDRQAEAEAAVRKVWARFGHTKKTTTRKHA